MFKFSINIIYNINKILIQYYHDDLNIIKNIKKGKFKNHSANQTTIYKKSSQIDKVLHIF